MTIFRYVVILVVFACLLSFVFQQKNNNDDNKTDDDDKHTRDKVVNDPQPNNNINNINNNNNDNDNNNNNNDPVLSVGTSHEDAWMPSEKEIAAIFRVEEDDSSSGGEQHHPPVLVDQQNSQNNELLTKMMATSCENIEEIKKELAISWKYFPEKPISFQLNNPYWPPHTVSGQEWRAADNVLKWYATYEQNSAVCALNWVDESRTVYRLSTFPHREEALRHGYTVTHDKNCGVCSTLQDLAIYLARPDLTVPVRTCARKPTLGLIKSCLEKTIGFTSLCAEAWAYNAANTKLFCSFTCIKDYGLENVLFNNLQKFPDNLPNGELRPCLDCDENTSGAGFKYAAGRTRRNSGIETNIERHEGEVSHIDHSLYFK